MRSPCLLLAFVALTAFADPTCNPFYVRWPRVKLNFKSVTTARLSLKQCETACSLGEDPALPGRGLECAALNHHESPDRFSHQCDVFQPHQLQNVDGYVEADDRYSFYWKFCLNSTRRCSGEYAFTYLSDRYMDSREVMRVSKKSSLEECLTECLEEKSFSCRSISFNRTDGGCHLSANSQLTKPGSVRLNNNPNFRIDYYENNCHSLSETFKFEQECREDGILVRVKSKVPYTGAFYGLYDYFTCRIEPKELSEFEYLFPSPLLSKNCSDSIRFKGDEMILEVVLHTDGVEPIYFVTPEDLTYQAKCPIQRKRDEKPEAPKPPLLVEAKNKEMEASAHALFSMLAKEQPLRKKETFPLPLTTPTTRSATQTTATTTAKITTTVPKTTTTTTAKLTTTVPKTTTTTTPKPTTTTTVPTTTTTKATTTTTTTTKQVSNTENNELKGNSIAASDVLDQNGEAIEKANKAIENVVKESNAKLVDDMGILEINTGTTEEKKKVEVTTEGEATVPETTEISSTSAAQEVSTSATASKNETSSTTTIITTPETMIPLGTENKDATVAPTTSQLSTALPTTSEVSKLPMITETKQAATLTTSANEITNAATMHTETSSVSTTVASTTIPVTSSPSSVGAFIDPISKLFKTLATDKETSSEVTTASTARVASQEIKIITVQPEKIVKKSAEVVAKPIDSRKLDMQPRQLVTVNTTKETKPTTAAGVTTKTTTTTTKPAQRQRLFGQQTSNHHREPILDRILALMDKGMTIEQILRGNFIGADDLEALVANRISESSTATSTKTAAPITRVNQLRHAKVSFRGAKTSTRAAAIAIPKMIRKPVNVSFRKAVAIAPKSNTSFHRSVARTTKTASNPAKKTDVQPIKQQANRQAAKPQLRQMKLTVEKGVVHRKATTQPPRNPIQQNRLSVRGKDRLPIQKKPSGSIRLRNLDRTPTHSNPASKVQSVAPAPAPKSSISLRRPSPLRRPTQNRNPKVAVRPTKANVTSNNSQPKSRHQGGQIMKQNRPQHRQNENFNMTVAPLRDVDGDVEATRSSIAAVLDAVPRLEKTDSQATGHNRQMHTLPHGTPHRRQPTTTAAKTSTTTPTAPTTTQRTVPPTTTPKPTTAAPTTATTHAATTTTTATPATSKHSVIPPAAPVSSFTSDRTAHRSPSPSAPGTETFSPKGVKNPVSFDIYKDGRSVGAVVVGSKITLSFTPHFPIPPEYMSIRGCQVEPIDPKYDWEKEPLPIIKDACPADLVGLVCPPKHSEFGIKVTVESFRYQTTPQVQYSCLVRICPFAPCPVASCASVDGCPSDDRSRRAMSISLEQIRAALEADPSMAREIGISPAMLANKPGHIGTVEQQLQALGGDHVVKRRLVVVNSSDQLRHYPDTVGPQ